MAESTQVVIALDVGGSSVKSALVTNIGQIVGDHLTTPIDSHGSAETIVATFRQIITLHLNKPYHYLGLAIGFPAPFDYEQGICRIDPSQKKYEGLYNVNVKTPLRTVYGGRELPIQFFNDADIAITGEARYGVGQPYQRVIGLTLGTGLGAGFIANGFPLTTGQGVPPNGELYPVLVGDVQADDVFSIRGLQGRFKAAGLPINDLKLASGAAASGDAVAKTVFAGFGSDLGIFLQPYVQAFGAEAVIILGGISGAFDHYGEAIQQALSVPVLAGRLGMEAALLGAAALAMPRLQTAT
ncbi:MAG: ROK family protein [Anaerolineae bacterium]|nr:ROK family protein [Anaerolineae bacterium]